MICVASLFPVSQYAGGTAIDSDNTDGYANLMNKRLDWLQNISTI
jgi:hypothetical protein